MDRETILQMALDMGFDHAALAAIDTLKPMHEVRDMCAVDKCHAYNKTWTCPPGCGTIEECAEKMKRYDFGILTQTTAQLEDSMDYEGMMEGHDKHKDLCNDFLMKLRETHKQILPLTSASCDICKVCTFPDAPCRFPEKAVSAMEGYGLLVSSVCKENNLDYYYGPNTVTYTALYLLKVE